MFHGNISSRSVKLSGSTHQADRSRIIEQAREERQRREAARQREIASVKIQSFWRNCKRIRFAHADAKLQLNSFLSLQSLWTPSIAQKAIRLLLFVIQPVSRRSNLPKSGSSLDSTAAPFPTNQQLTEINLILLVLRRCATLFKATDFDQSYHNLFIDTKGTYVWIHQIRSLTQVVIVSCFRLIACAAAPSDPNSSQSDVLAQLAFMSNCLLLLTDTSQWPWLAKHEPQSPHVLRANLAIVAIVDSAAVSHFGGITAVLRKMMLEFSGLVPCTYQKSLTTPIVVISAVMFRIQSHLMRARQLFDADMSPQLTIHRRVFTSSEIQRIAESFLGQIFDDILTIPLLSHRFEQLSLQSIFRNLCSNTVLSPILSFVSSVALTTTENSSPSRIASASDIQSAHSLNNRASFLSSRTHAFGNLASILARQENDSNSAANELFVSCLAKLWWFGIDEALVTSPQFSHLSSPHFLKQVVSVLDEHHYVDFQSVHSFSLVSGLLVSILRHQEKSESVDFTNLGFALLDLHVPDTVFNFIQSTGSVHSIIACGYNFCIDSSLIPILLFYMECTWRGLCLVDDDDFYSEKYFTLNYLTLSIPFIRNIVLRLVWGCDVQISIASRASGLELFGNQKSDLSRILLLATEVLRNLHERQCRRPFTQQSDFLVLTEQPPYQTIFSTNVLPLASAFVTPFAISPMFTYDLFQRQLLSDNFFDSEFANTGSSSDVSIVSRFMLSDSLVDMNLLKSASSKLIVSTPFAFPFSVRVDIFYRLIARDRELAEGRNIHFSPGFGEQITVRRDKLVEDSLLQINPLKNRLKGRVRISFVSSEGLPEAGIDGGGLFKEFLITFCTQAFNPALGLFRETDSRYLYPNPMSDQLDSFELLGRVVGKALYESILVQPQFANFFLRKLQGRTNFKNELSSLDKHLQDSAHFLKNYSGDFSALSLTFSSSRDGAGAAETVDLIPNGREVAVTAESKLTFIALLSHFKLNTQIRTQTSAFIRGLQDVVNPAWLQLFSSSELQRLISGSGQVDIKDWQAHTVYNGWSESDFLNGPIAWFWEVVSSFSDSERQQLLLFATSCSRAPLLGFAALSPKFCINVSDGSSSSLPTASTCMNLLRLPRYRSKANLREKVLVAISSQSGFELS